MINELCCEKLAIYTKYGAFNHSNDEIKCKVFLSGYPRDTTIEPIEYLSKMNLDPIYIVKGVPFPFREITIHECPFCGAKL